MDYITPWHLALDSEYVERGGAFGRRSIPRWLKSSAVRVQVVPTEAPDKYLSVESSGTKESPLVLAVAACQLIPDTAEIEYLWLLSSGEASLG